MPKQYLSKFKQIKSKIKNARVTISPQYLGHHFLRANLDHLTIQSILAMANLESDEKVLKHIQKKYEDIVMVQRTRRLCMQQNKEQDLDPSLLESQGSHHESSKSHITETRGFDLDPGLQVSIEDGLGVNHSLEGGVDMTKVVVSREKRPHMSVRSSNLEIQISTIQRTLFISLELLTRVWWIVDFL